MNFTEKTVLYWNVIIFPAAVLGWKFDGCFGMVSSRLFLNGNLEMTWKSCQVGFAGINRYEKNYFKMKKTTSSR